MASSTAVSSSVPSTTTTAELQIGTTPIVGGTTTESIAMTVVNLDYGVLVADQQLLSDFEAAARESVASWMRSGGAQVTDGDVQLFLSQGSVVIIAQVSFTDGPSAESVAALDRRELASGMAAALASLPWLAAAATGPLWVRVEGAEGAETEILFPEEEAGGVGGRALCPLGAGGPLSCGAQLSSLAAACALLLCCAAGAALRWAGRGRGDWLPTDSGKHRAGWRKWCRCLYLALKALYPPRDEGSVQVRGFSTKYRVERTTAAPADGEGPQKTRVVWETADRHLDSLGPKDAEAAEEGQLSPWVSDASTRSSPPTLLTPSWPQRGPQNYATEGKKTAVEAASYAAYCDGATVEYFSVRHQQWIAGRVHAALCGGAARYDVQLPRSGQRRFGVALDLLRPPLCAGEAVECGPLKPTVASSTGASGPLDDDLVAVGEQPQWQRGAVIKPEVSRAAVTDYLVLLEGVHGPATVPSSQVRRHFQPGSEVEIYRGVEFGWLGAEVAHGIDFQEHRRAGTATAAALTGTEHAPSQRGSLAPSPGRPPSGGASFAVDAVGAAGSVRSGASVQETPTGASLVGGSAGGAVAHGPEVQSAASMMSACGTSAEAPPWALLPIRTAGPDGGGGGEGVEWFPAFLVRRAQ